MFRNILNTGICITLLILLLPEAQAQSNTLSKTANDNPSIGNNNVTAKKAQDSRTIWDRITSGSGDCTEVTFPTIESDDISCPEDVPGWVYVMELSDFGTNGFLLSNSENESIIEIADTNIISAGPFSNPSVVTLTFTSVDFPDCFVTYTVEGDCSQPCEAYADGPYDNFDTQGVPVPDANGICDVVTLEGFEVWMSEAYTLSDLPADVTYVFSACQGPGAGTWPITYTIYGPNDDIVGLTSAVDNCSISWYTEIEGDYLVVINRLGYCGIGGEIDNGHPSVTCSGVVNTVNIESVDAHIFPNPADDQINVVIPLNGPAQMRIFDALGRLVVERNLQLNGNNFVQPVSNLDKGIYTLQILTSDKIAEEKFLKQ